MKIKRRYVATLNWVALLALLAVSNNHWGRDGFLPEVLFPTGIALIAVCVSGRLWVLVYHSGYKNKTLLTEGPYSLCRHPLYLCNLLGGVGVGLTTGTLTIPILSALTYAPIFAVVARDEERRLRERHGIEFDLYRAATPMLLPSWSRFREPHEYSVRVRRIRARLAHAVWPLTGTAVVSVIQSLHVHHLLPGWLTLY